MLLPGIVEILADSELVFLAISSDKFIIFETLTPAAGSNSFKVTTGPLLIFLIFPSTPKSNNIFSKKSSLISNSFLGLSTLFFGSFSILSFGNLNVIFLFLVFSLKAKFSCVLFSSLSKTSSLFVFASISVFINFSSFFLKNINKLLINLGNNFNLKLIEIKNINNIIITKK